MNPPLRGVMSVKVWIPVLFLVGCATILRSTNSRKQARHDQGASPQGTSTQGTSTQGTSTQGTSTQGTSSGGAAVSNATVVGTDLQYWVAYNSGQYYWQYTARSRCLWDSTRTTKIRCTNYDLATQASPLVGSQWPTVFVRDNGDGTKTNVHVKLEVKRVFNDTSPAMYDLRGTGAPGPMVDCDNPGNCRRNTDLFLYDVNVIGTDDTEASLCPPGQSAMALAGYWDKTATHHDSASKFAFVCTNGTIAKCVRWGYRPWASALKNGKTTGLTSLASYHQGCVRAAMADYCGDGTSFTKDGTVVDIFDYSYPSFPGFIKQRRGFLTQEEDDQSMVGEGAFSTIGADWLDHFRYQERQGEIEQRCGDAFVRPAEIVEYQRRQTAVGPLISIMSTPACAHSHLMTGRWLHPGCSQCVREVATVKPACIDPTGPGWTDECVKATEDRPAHPFCNTENYPTHDECTAGRGLGVYASGCTLKLSLKGFASCFNVDSSTAWTAACVAAANQQCTGGQEHTTALNKYGFCNQILSTVVTHL